MLWKSLILAGIFASAIIARAAVDNIDGCEARLGTVDRYYGVFATSLASGKLNDRHLDVAIASPVPINPIAKETPTVEIGQLRDFLDDLVRDSDVRSLWPQTVEALRKLRAVRQREAVASDQAAAATAKVLAPRMDYEFDTISSSVSAARLPGGRNVLAHIEGDQELVVVDSENKSATRFNLPPEAKKSKLTRLTWYRDKEGQLWIYLSLVGNSWLKVFRLKWLDLNFADVTPDLPGSMSIRRLFNPFPGILIAQDNETCFDIASGEPVKVPPYSLVHDRWVYDKSGELHRGAVSTGVFMTSTGPIYVEVDSQNIRIKRPQGVETISAPANHFRVVDFTYFEPKAGREFLAVIYSPGLNDYHFAFWDLAKSQTPVNTVKIKGNIITNLHWLMERAGIPLLALTTDTGDGPKLIVLDPGSPEPRLTMPIPGPLENWLDIGDQIYFSTLDFNGHNSVFRMFSERGKPR